MSFLLRLPIFRGYVKFPGCMLVSGSVPFFLTPTDEQLATSIDDIHADQPEASWPVLWVSVEGLSSFSRDLQGVTPG